MSNTRFPYGRLLADWTTVRNSGTNGDAGGLDGVFFSVICCVALDAVKTVGNMPQPPRAAENVSTRLKTIDLYDVRKFFMSAIISRLPPAVQAFVLYSRPDRNSTAKLCSAELARLFSNP